MFKVPDNNITKMDFRCLLQCMHSCPPFLAKPALSMQAQFCHFKTKDISDKFQKNFFLDNLGFLCAFFIGKISF